MSWVRSRQTPGAVLQRRAAYPQGDPGLLSFLGKAASAIGKTAIGFATGGVGGAIQGAVSALAPRKVGASGVAMQPMTLGVEGGRLVPREAVMPGGAVVGSFSGFQAGPVQIGTTRYAPTVPSTISPGNPAGTTPCTSGYHYNKTGYWTKAYGYISPRTVCVRNRKRNPLNPRALSRSMSRLAGARKAIQSLVSFERVATPKGKLRIRRPAKRKCA